MSLRSLTVPIFSLFTLAFVPSAQADVDALDRNRILLLHNVSRTEVGAAPLAWSDSLASGAQNWADQMAADNQMRHSGTPGVGENLAVGWGNQASTDTLVGMWIKEKSYYAPGVFPAVSSNGNWHSVGHYTQMIWKRTTEVGCGEAKVASSEFLVCRYGPAGNVYGQSPQ